MRKRLLIALVVVLALAATASVVWAGGPAEKATGMVALQSVTGQTGRYLEFNAHEEQGDREAKGQVHWWRIDPDSSTYDFYATVTQVLVTSGYAKISGIVDSSTFSNIAPGYTFYFEIWDNSTPGADGVDGPDEVYWKWTSGLSASQTYEAVDGNLVVHTY